MQYRRVFLENSFVFITIVTSKRRHILIDNIELLRKAFEYAKVNHQFEIVSAVILPDHFHMIINPAKTEDYPIIIRLIKSYFSRNIDIGKILDYKLSKSQKSKNEKDIWQRRYYEHTIIDEKDLHNHIDYIHFNPVKHSYVKNVKEWKLSSFDKFVKQGFYELDWGCLEDIEGIIDLDYE